MIINKFHLKLTLFMLVSSLLLSTAAPLTATSPMQTSDSFSVTIDAIAYQFDNIDTPLGEFASITIDNTGNTIVVGQPQLPVLRHYIEVPYGADPEISIQSESWTSTSLAALNLPLEILPVQPSVQKDSIQTPAFIYDQDIYAQTSPLFTTLATITSIGILRGRQIALLEINPIHYVPATGELTLLDSVELEIRFPNADTQLTQQIHNRYSTKTYEQLFQTLFINDDMIQPPAQPSGRQEGYLIIVWDNYYNDVQAFASWKTTQGFDVTVTKTSDIPGGATTTNIYNYIDDAYSNWATPPTYVLLVGDTPHIPTFTGSDSYSEADLYYVTVDGTDYFPDIYIGRFPAGDATDLAAMLDKTMYYEAGNFASNDWIKKGAFIASSDAGQLAEQTHNFVIDNFLLPRGYIVDKIYEASGGSTSDIVNALNDGRSLCVYSGHGYPGGWACVPFDQTDIQNLMNADMYPFVTSHACSTNTFGDSECYGETWLRVADKGAIGFWGASASTYWDEDDILEKAMFQAWFADGLEWLGGMTDMGLYYLYQNYSGGGMTQYYYEAYNILGDPSLIIWSDDPDPNMPPETPNAPSGPDTGVCNRESSFTASTTDPEGYDVYYKFDWGDGTYSEWIGPMASGTTGTDAHAWADPAIYEVRVKAMDINGTESPWSEPALIEIVDGPLLDVGLINGGFFRVKSVIRNHGATAAENVDWSITLDGGTILLGQESTGTIPSIPAGDIAEVQSGMIFGFGPTRVTVYAEIPEGADYRDQGATIFLFFVHIKPGGG